MARNTEFDPPSGIAGSAVRWVLVGAVVVAVVSGIGLAFGVVSLPMRSAAGIAEQTLNPDNVIATYERFHDRWKGFEARRAQVRETAGLFSRETDTMERGRLGIELRAQRQSCREIAAGYNADVAKTNRDIFRGKDAPEALNGQECEL